MRQHRPQLGSRARRWTVWCRGLSLGFRRNLRHRTHCHAPPLPETALRRGSNRVRAGGKQMTRPLLEEWDETTWDLGRSDRCPPRKQVSTQTSVQTSWGRLSPVGRDLGGVRNKPRGSVVRGDRVRYRPDLLSGTEARAGNWPGRFKGRWFRHWCDGQ